MNIVGEYQNSLTNFRLCEEFRNRRKKRILRDSPEMVDPKDQPRNEKCACGSGKKYKKCCGAPQHMDLTIQKGSIITFGFYNGSDKNEYESMLNLVNTCKDNDFPLCMKNGEVKVLDVKGTAYESEAISNYSIEVKGEIL